METVYKKRIKDHMPELIVVLLYTALHIFVRLFHEGCFDEVHAWNIAKDASIYEIIFKVPYYEGHPALWHLILFPFVRLGLSIDISMTIITTVFSVLAVYVLVFKSPFPRVVKLVLPFTYFFFYQYSIVARPYCMTMLAMVLLACFYKERDEKPVRFTLALGFLCATSAFGVAIAGGIAVVWVFKILKNDILAANDLKSKKFSDNDDKGYWKRRFLTDKKIICLVVLLIYVIFLAARVLPINPYGGMNYVGDRSNGILLRALYLFVGLFADLFMTNSYTHDFLADFPFETYDLAITCVLGAAILVGVLYVGKKVKTFLEFVIPFVFLSVFSVLVYFCVHNSGILLLLLVYWVWISWERIDAWYHELRAKRIEVQTNSDKSVDESEIRKAVMTSEKSKGRSFLNYAWILVVVTMGFPLFWSISAGVTDVMYPYSFGENESEFLKKNGLESASICFEWNMVLDPTKEGSLEYYDMMHIINMDRIYAYLDVNPGVASLDNSNDDLSYNSGGFGHRYPDFINWPFDYSLYKYFHRPVTLEENTKIIEILRSNPKPDVLMGEPDLKLLNGEDYRFEDDYELAFKQKIVKPWKSFNSTGESRVYVRKDIADLVLKK